MKTLGPVTFSKSGQPLAHILICCRTRKEWLAQRAQIKTGAAYQDGRMITRFNLLYLLNCRTRPISRSKSFERRNKIDQVMRNAAPLFNGNFSGRNLYLLIDLN